MYLSYYLLFEKSSLFLDCDWDYTDFSFWAKCSYACGYETNQEKGSPIDIVTASVTTDTFTLSTPDGGTIESNSYRDVMHSFCKENLSKMSKISKYIA